MNDLDKRYYKIREVAEILGLPASTLRFWEHNFTILKPKRTSHQARLYTPADIETLRMIRYLVKDKGLKLDAAEAEIRRNRSGVSRRYEAIERLHAIRTQLIAIQDALDTRMRRNKVASATPVTADTITPVKNNTESDNTLAIPSADTIPADNRVSPKHDSLQQATDNHIDKQPKKRRSKKHPDPDIPTLF